MHGKRIVDIRVAIIWLQEPASRFLNAWAALGDRNPAQ